MVTDEPTTEHSEQGWVEDYAAIDVDPQTPSKTTYGYKNFAMYDFGLVQRYHFFQLAASRVVENQPIISNLQKR